MSFEKGKICARLRKHNYSEFLGYFTNKEEAFQAYKQAKEEYIKTEAENYKSQIDPRVYEALMNYEISYED